MPLIKATITFALVFLSCASWADNKQDHIAALETLLTNPGKVSTKANNDDLTDYLATRGIDASLSTVGFYQIIISGLMDADELPVGDGAELIRAEELDNKILKSTWFNPDQQTFFIMHTRLSGDKVEVFDFENLSYDTRLHEYARLVNGKNGILLMASYGKHRQEVLSADKNEMWQAFDAMPASLKNTPILHNALIQEMSEHLIGDDVASFEDFYKAYNKRLPKHNPRILLYNYIHQGDYKRAKPYLNDLKKETGDHSWFYFADMAKYLDRGNKKGYKATYEILAKYPDEEMLYSTLLEHFVFNGMHEEAVLVTAVYYTKFDIYFDPDVLATFGDEYSDFAKSDTYQNWLERKGLK